MHTLATIIALIFAPSGGTAPVNAAGRGGPSALPPHCTHAYTLRGVSQGNARLRGARGNVVHAIDIGTNAALCPVVGISVDHLEGVALVAPTGMECVRTVRGHGTASASFHHDAKCGCAEEWEWTMTNYSPPVQFRVRVRPDTSCAK